MMWEYAAMPNNTKTNGSVKQNAVRASTCVVVAQPY